MDLAPLVPRPALVRWLPPEKAAPARPGVSIPPVGARRVGVEFARREYGIQVLEMVSAVVEAIQRREQADDHR